MSCVGRRRHERQAGARSELGTGLAGECGMRIEAGAHRGAAERQFEQRRQRGIDRAPRQRHLRVPGTDLLPHGQRHRVLQVRAAQLDDVRMARRQGLQRGLQRVQRRQQALAPGQDQRQVQRRGHGVVR